MQNDDTICAISTPIGEGGIGIIRMSGKDAHPILKNIFRPAAECNNFTSHKMYLGYIVDPGKATLIDEVFAVFMNPPNTYTKESMAEIHAHGSLATNRSILSLLMRQGARLAEPGEFTKRAFLNGRIDLLQAESVLDIIRSETDEELAHAICALQGVLSQRLNSLKNIVRDALVEVEAHIDFPDDDIDLDRHRIVAGLDEVTNTVLMLIDSYCEGKAVRDGFDVLIVGKPNAGKSSLLNALLMKEKAIVTPFPGTTRDMIEDTLHIKGIKVRITDSAGLHDASVDPAENEGIVRVRKRIRDADFLIWVIDGATPYSPEDDRIYETIKDKKYIIAINKTDLPALFDRESVPLPEDRFIEVSALYGQGIDILKESLYNHFLRQGTRQGDILIANIRHKDTLQMIKAAVEGANTCLKNDEPLEFVCFELREALYHFGEMTGETCTEDILDAIFGRFCIGK